MASETDDKGAAENETKGDGAGKETAASTGSEGEKAPASERAAAEKEAPASAEKSAETASKEAEKTEEEAPPESGKTASKEAEKEAPPKSGKPASKEAASKEPASKEPASKEPASKEPASKEAAAARTAKEPEAPPNVPKEAPKGAAWGDPIATFEARWTWLESRLLVFVVLWQLGALVAWVFLNGLAESVTGSAGVVFRAVLFGTILGVSTWFGGKNMPNERRTLATVVALVAGLALAPVWRSAVQASPTGALARLDKSTLDYFDGIKAWLQQASTLTLMGGLRGLGTRLTLWLALLGGSLATASGKHIHVDVVFRFLPKKFRVPAALVNYCAAAAVCLAATWGFIDHMAITSYGSKDTDTPSVKIQNTLHHLGDHFFFTRKQIGLDLQSLPKVLGGTRYDQWMTGRAWNEWVDGAGYEARFTPDEIKTIKVPDDTANHLPLVLSPKGETMPSVLAHTLGLVFPFGLFAIALRFLIRALLTLSGHVSADPDEAHKEDMRGADQHIAEPNEASEKGGV